MKIVMGCKLLDIKNYLFIYSVIIYFSFRFHSFNIGAILLIFVGLYFGINSFRKEEYIKNIPTSKIRSVPMGSLVEVSGRAVSSELQKTLDGKEVVFYIYELQEKSGRNKEWTTLDIRKSRPYFYINDGTGSLLISTKEAEFLLKEDKIYDINFLRGNDLSEEVINFLTKNHCGIVVNKENKKVFKCYPFKNVRLVQYSISPGENVYAIGRVENIKINDKEMPVMVKDKTFNIYIISDFKEKKVVGYMKKLMLLHFGMVGLGILLLLLKYELGVNFT